MPFVTASGDIADVYQQVVNAISNLASKQQQNEHTKLKDIPTDRYQDEIQRLAIWGGEHRVHEGKLDYKLREASLLREQVCSLLNNLLELTDAAAESEARASTEASVNLETVEEGVDIEALQKLQLKADSCQVQDDLRSHSTASSSGLDTNISLEDSVPDSSASQIHDAITLLFELGPSLSDPAPHDRLQHAITSEAAQFDLDHVESKYPKASQKLIHRVGFANWERRRALRNLRFTYEDQHGHVPTQKHSQTSTEADIEDNTVDEDVSCSSDSGCSPSVSIFAPSYTASIPLSSVGTTKTALDTIFSGPENRSMLGTDLSELQDQPAQDQTQKPQKYRIPQPPEPNNRLTGESFLCPYCYKLLSGIKSRSQWKKHVFEDLEPYVCTYDNCVLAGKTYGDKHAWWEHETEKHRAIRVWKCSPCERGGKKSSFNNVEAFDEHIKERHPTISTQVQLWSVRELCQERVGLEEPHSQCPFCQETIHEKGAPSISPRAVENAVRSHISKHFEQLALFVAFPAWQMTLKDDDSEFIDDSDFETEFKTEIESILSDGGQITRQEVRLRNVSIFIAEQTGSIAPPATSQNAQQQGTTSSQPTFIQQAFPLRILTHPPNEHFYGRDKLMEEAHSILNSPGSICIFHGVGGIGKTLAAVEYIYRNQDQYDAIFWLAADTAPSLSDSYMQMGVALGLINKEDDHLQAMDRGRSWLQETPKQWLLVFDNALAWDQISPYMPNNLQQSKGSILITGQSKSLVRDSENIFKLRLEALDQEQGSEMLLKYLGKDIYTDTERDLAREISTFVGGLPIAIAHVAGYAEVSSYSLEELIETFREWRKRTGIATDEADDLPVSFRQAAFSYDETLAMVWNVTLRELSKDAQDVMHILAYLNSEAVPQNMLFTIHEDQSLHFLDSRESLRNRRLRDSLIRRRLVHSKEVDGEWCFSVHRSLQRGIRGTLSQDAGKQQLVFGQAVALLREVFPRSNPLQQPTPDRWSEYQRLLPHLHALHDIYNRYKPQVKGSIDFAQLLSDAGMDQFERGITKEGLMLLKTAEEVLDSVATKGDHQTLRANIHAMIGIMYDNTGIEMRREGLYRREVALELRKQPVENSPEPRRDDEILLYNSWMEYAISLLHYHRFEEAEPIIESCLKKYGEWGTENEIPFEYAKYYNKIGIVRMYQLRFDEAIGYATRGAHLMSKTGYLLFETRFRFDLACIILQSGDVDGALKVHREIFDSRLEKLGQTNELTLHSRYAIGAIYEIKGQYEEAEFWFRKALGPRRGVSTWPDEAFSRAQYHLARVLLLQGNPEDVEVAGSLREKALAVLHRLLPLDHPNELKGCTDDAVLFDHMLTISGARFTGQGLLRYFSKKD